MKKHLTVLIVFCLTCFLVNSQNKNEVKVVFQPIFGNQLLFLDSTYTFEKDEIEFSTLKFYISNFKLLNKDKNVFIEQNSFHLFDAEDIKKQSFTLAIPKGLLYTNLVFNLGIDSVTNTSGALGGDLDPTNGMYWTWQSGYVNFKIEGTSSACINKRKEFQYHLGGYMFPFLSLQKISLDIKSKSTIIISVDLRKIIETFNVSNLFASLI
jgi:hypothetical protein